MKKFLVSIGVTAITWVALSISFLVLSRELEHLEVEDL